MSSDLRIYKVAGGEHGSTLQEFLCNRTGVTRSRAKKLLDQRAVFVNHQRVWMARHKLEADDQVEVRMPKSAPAAPREVPVQILYEDADYIIVNKPANMLSNGERSTETRLQAQLRNPGLCAVHRLDRDTSGCFLLAKSPAAFNAMVEVFQQRDVRKTYIALVRGRVPHTLRAVRQPVDGQEAITHMKILRATQRATLLELQPETGRTHQIRRHMASTGHPLIGDKQYETRAVADDAARHAPRQMLHASKISFANPQTGAIISANAPIPEDFRDTQRELGILTP